MSEPSTPPQLTKEEAAELKGKARRGVIILVMRTVLLQFTILGGNVTLARALEPKDFGVFAVIQYALAFFAIFGDAGLGAALIQQRHAPSKRELSSVFLLQLLLSGAVIALAAIAAGWVRILWPDLPESGPWLMRILAFNLFLVTVKLVPTMLMERELQFGRLSAIDFVQTVAFFGCATVMALMGYGVWALLAGLMLQGVTGAILAFAFRPWFPEFVMDWALLRPILRYGMAYQLKMVVAFANGATTPVYAGRLLGMTSVGYINWAQTTAYFPLKLVEVVARVTFPLFSRLRDDKKLLAQQLGQSVQICTLFTVFMSALFLSNGLNITRVVFGDKWLPAVPFLYVFATAITIGFVSPVISSAFDAMGRPGVVTRVTIGWTVLNWIVITFTTPRWGAMGFVIGYCVHMVVGNIVIVWLMYKLIPGVRLWPKVRAAIVAGAVVWALGYYVTRHFSGVWYGLIAAVLLCALAFAGVVFLLDRSALVDALALFRKKKAEPDPNC